MGAKPHANGGLLFKDFKMPNFRVCAVAVPKSGTVFAEATGSYWGTY
jgi:xylulose-5-phosphate/fructose-6-phosphate phosphoketolase